ncbi:protein of unknown function [Micromonospora pallida]|uniref:DUF4279 domain-containing protein n=1 Tax=Micromonospora pallida TaxID=145854 RepID=A0A1C6T7F0_9ACTN|nr:DUF4279 domain-containing protein [Micromonospora pallida]SCL37589.1 protein of unknown function [Micromonospora pallida]
MRVRQYVYFSLQSDQMPADEMAARLDMEADEAKVKASRRANPPVPRCHAWKVVCRDDGLTVDEQIDQVIGRLQPITDRIAALAREIDASEGEWPAATLQVVRYFGDEDSEEENPQPDDTDLVRLPSQHQLLGWHLDRRVLEFLQNTGAELDVDEYGY